MIKKEKLNKLYIKKGKSVHDISLIFNCSESSINYWLHKYKIKKRTIGEAIYLKNNPNGDPFKFREPKNISEGLLFGMGIGLYWGEGTKADKNTIRLGNSDPKLIKMFILFLNKFFAISRSKLKFQLQIFSDIDTINAENFWIKILKIKKNQFYKTIISRSVSSGTYKHKSKYGVITLYFSNVKARNIIYKLLPM